VTAPLSRDSGRALSAVGARADGRIRRSAAPATGIHRGGWTWQECHRARDFGRVLTQVK